MNLKCITIIPPDDAVFKVSFFNAFIIPKAIIKINKMMRLFSILNQINNIKLLFNYSEFPNNSITINHD